MKHTITLILLFVSIVCNGQKSEYYFNTGVEKAKLQDYRGAIQDYTKAIELDPEYADAYNNRGIARLLLEDKDGGCLDLSKAGELGHFKAYDLIKEYCN